MLPRESSTRLRKIFCIQICIVKMKEEKKIGQLCAPVAPRRENGAVMSAVDVSARGERSVSAPIEGGIDAPRRRHLSPADFRPTAVDGGHGMLIMSTMSAVREQARRRQGAFGEALLQHANARRERKKAKARKCLRGNSGDAGDGGTPAQ